MKRFKSIGLICLLLVMLPAVSNAASWADRLVNGVVFSAGFEYDYDKDIYRTRQYALQRLFGFNNIYDMMAAPVGMAIQVEPVRFTYDGQDYMVELWKGQYYASVGAEIGFYVGTEIDIDGETHYRCANDEEMLDLAFDLVRQDPISREKEVLYQVEGTHWWLTGFKPGVFAYPDELVLENIRITFPSSEMAEAFQGALVDLGYQDVAWYDGTVEFTFSTPGCPQPWDDEQLEYVLTVNKAQVAATQGLAVAFDLEDFSPASIAGAIEDNFWYGLYIYYKFKKSFGF